MTTLEQLRAEKYKNHAAVKSGYFNHVFKVKKPKSAANLEALIEEYVNLMGGIATIVNSGGRQVTTRTATEYLGAKGHVVNTAFIPSTTRKGTSDIICSFHGQVIYVEIKFSKGDRLSDYQKKFKEEVEKSGAEYWVIKKLEEFEEKFSIFALIYVNTTINTI